MRNEVSNEWLTRIRALFKESPPNGWLLGWDESRFFNDFTTILKSYGELVNETSFDYDFCNTYCLYIGNRSDESFESLTILLSFVADAFHLSWTRYWLFGRNGATFEGQSAIQIEIENRCRDLAERLGFKECSADMFERPVDGVRLELSGEENVTLGKCLFVDFDDK